jgi:DNA-binding MurR/RpiR family transcriptional regulator
MTILEQMRESYRTMSAVDRRIADVILEDPVEAANMPIAHMATAAGVSEGSVVNFAGHMGFKGFSALKIGIAREADMFQGFSFGSVTEKDTPSAALRKVAGNAVDAFQKTSQLLQNEDLLAVAKALQTARRIDIYGAGDSALMAQDAYFHFMRAGLPAYAVTDYLTFSIAAGQLDESCVALAISHSGQTMEIVDAMRIARRHGAKTICITSRLDSALRELCDTSLVTFSAEADRYQEAGISRLVHLLVIDALCAYIGAQQGPEMVERMDEVSLQLARHRYQR